MATLRGWIKTSILLASITLVSGCNRGGPELVLPDSPMVEVGKIKEGTECRVCGISLFSNKKIAIEIHKIVHGKRMGYTHLAEGEVKEEDGVAIEPDKEHFGFYEYEASSLSSRFKEIEKL